MRKKNVQISLFDTYTDVCRTMEEDKPAFLTLLDEHIDFEAIIPPRFYHAYYSYTGRKRVFSLESFIRAFVIQRLLGMTHISQLRMLLTFSKEIRDFCGFDRKIPDAPQFTRFKQTFADHLGLMFQNLSDLTAPICRELDEKKAAYLIFDTTGIEPDVKENNPKFFNTMLQLAKSYAKNNPGYDPYRAVYGLLPDDAASAPMARQQHINGHYCYSYKAGIITDGLGIVRHIAFFDEDFRKAHPEVVTPKTDDPDKDKEIGDSTALRPVLDDFFRLHPQQKFSTFLGDAAFDSYDNYAMLKNDFGFKRVCVPLNPRNAKTSSAEFNQFGNPVCPLKKEQFTCVGKCGGKNRSLRFKWVCPGSKQKGNSRVCTCETPCTDSSYGKCVYTYPEKNFRDCPGIPRNTEHWDNLYKHRVLVERTINIFKDSFGLDDLKTRDTRTIKADLYLAGCTQLIGVILAKAIQQDRLYKSTRKLVDLVA